MSFEERMSLSGWVGQYLTDEFVNRYRESHVYAGVQYNLEPAEDDDPDAPLILVRRSDGRRFEIEIEVMVHELKPVRVQPVRTVELPAEDVPA